MLVLALAAGSGCGGGVTGGGGEKPPAFAETIAFGGQTLGKANAWTRGRMSGAVYVPPGETLPQASLQVGALISAEHTTAAALHDWVGTQFYASGNKFQGHYSGTADESCRIARDMESTKRTFTSLVVCKTGVARAVCVEADETVDASAFNTCIGNDRCFEDICGQRWLARREALDLFAADVITIR